MSSPPDLLKSSHLYFPCNEPAICTSATCIIRGTFRVKFPLKYHNSPGDLCSIVQCRFLDQKWNTLIVFLTMPATCMWAQHGFSIDFSAIILQDTPQLVNLIKSPLLQPKHHQKFLIFFHLMTSIVIIVFFSRTSKLTAALSCSIATLYLYLQNLPDICINLLYSSSLQCQYYDSSFCFQ